MEYFALHFVVIQLNKLSIFYTHSTFRVGTLKHEAKTKIINLNLMNTQPKCRRENEQRIVRCETQRVSLFREGNFPMNIDHWPALWVSGNFDHGPGADYIPYYQSVGVAFSLNYGSGTDLSPHYGSLISICQLRIRGQVRALWYLLITD